MWTKIEENNLKKITKGMKLCEKGKYKIILKIPPYECKRNGFGGANGFKVKIGANDFIEVTVKMLEEIYNLSVQNDNIFCSRVFGIYNSHLKKIKPCYVQTIGGIFEKAGLMVKEGRKFIIKDDTN